MIPKIIHHIAPADKTTWHIIWPQCYDSWQRHFPDYQFCLWNDSLDLENFVQNYYFDLYHTFMKCPAHIIKIDFVRPLILHYFGGIYVDMDLYCYQNFEQDLNNSVCLIGSPWPGETVNNCLMAGQAQHPFWMHYAKTIQHNLQSTSDDLILTPDDVPDVNLSNNQVLKISGPRALESSVTSYSGSDITILPKEEYQQDQCYYGPELKTRHFLTGRWGIDYYNALVRRNKEDCPELSLYEYSVLEYYNARGINVENFDFYTNYH